MISPKVRFMKDKRFSFGIVKILLAMGMLFTTFTTVKAEDDFKDRKLNINPSEKVSQEGETTTLYIDGLNYDYTGTPYYIGSDHQLKIHSEFNFQNLEIEKITIPTMIDSDYDQLQISLMLFLDGGKGFDAVTRQVADINEGPIVITKAEINAWLSEENGGVMPYNWFLFIHPKDSKREIFNEPTQKMVLDGPVEIEYLVTDKSNYFDNALNNWNVTHNYEPHEKIGENDNGSPIFKRLNRQEPLYAIRSGLQSSSIDIDHVSQDNLNQGDEFTLDFNLINESSYNKNNRLNVGIKLESDDLLELVDNDKDSRYRWVQDGNIFRMHLTDEEGHYANVSPKELVAISKTFKVKNIKDDSIVIKPFIYNEMDSNKKYYGEEISIKTVLPIQSSTINVTYVDQNNVEIKDHTVMLGQLDAEYEILVPDIDGYTFKTSSIDLKGTYDALEKQAELIYEKIEDIDSEDKEDKTSKIYVHYHDEKDNVIKDTLVVEGVVGDEYVIDTLTIEGYEYKESTDDLLQLFTEEDAEVTLIYTEMNEDVTNGTDPIVEEKPIIKDNYNNVKQTLPKTGVDNSSLIVPASIIVGLGVIILIIKKKSNK